jgi:O-antigen ligase
VASALGSRLGSMGAVPRTVPAPAIATTPVNRIVLAAFYLMVFSFNFEMPDRGGWEIPAMTAALFIASTPLAFRVCYGRVPGALYWFAGFLWVYLVSSLVHGWVDFGDVRHYFIVLVEAAIVCWASVNLLSREAIGTAALWCFVFSALARSVLPMLGIGRTSYAVWTGGERMTAFGQNANFSAILLSAGLVTLLGLTFGRRTTSHRMRLAALPIGVLIGAAIIETGSRGGLLALGGGLVALMFTAGGSLNVRLRNGLVTVLSIGVLTYAAFTATVMKNRLEATAETGTLAGREQLWPSLVEMALEKPWGGWGPINNQYEVASRTTDMAKEHRDAHNLLLELMTAEGLAGTAPFLIGLGMCVVAAWRGRTSPYGIVPFALVALFLVANISTNLSAYKPFWWVLAVALGSRSLAAPPATEGGTRPCAA